jgi:hypothetical protein
MRAILSLGRAAGLAGLWPADCDCNIGKMRITLLAAPALTLLAATAVPIAAAASTPGDGAGDHLRTTEPGLRALIDEGMRRSPTFRALVQRLTGSDVVVYIHSEVRQPSRSDGYMTFVATAGGYRYVLIRIRERRTWRHHVALLAHELRHAVEVAETPSIVDSPSLARAYRRLGYTSRAASNGGGMAFDTDAAIAAGFQVLAEVEGRRPHRRRQLPINAELRRGAGTEMNP